MSAAYQQGLLTLQRKRTGGRLMRAAAASATAAVMFRLEGGGTQALACAAAERIPAVGTVFKPQRRFPAAHINAA